jgi:hypothetical protein
LDLVFVNSPGLSVSLSLDYLVPADRFHPALSIFFLYVSKAHNYYPHATYFDFRRTNFLRISEFMLSFNWLATFADINANLAMNLLYDALHEGILKFVPTAKYRSPSFPVWFSKDLRDIVFRKRKTHAIFKATGNSQDYKNFSFLRAMYKYESNKCYRRFVERTEADFCANPRRFWDFVRKNNKENSIPKIVTLNNQSSNSDADTIKS